MKINGVNRKFRLTIGAVADISAICPDGDIDRMGELFDSPEINTILTATAKIAVAMNKYTDLSVDPLTVDEVFAMDMDQFKLLQEELLAAYKIDSTPKVNVRSKKKAEPKQ